MECNACDAHLTRVPPAQKEGKTQRPKKKKKKQGTIAPDVVHLGRGDGARTTFGRQVGTVDVVLDDGALHTVSRRHATVEQQRAGLWALCDNGSLNGVFLNDVRVSSGIPVELHEGDRIVFGGGGQLPPGSKFEQPQSQFAFVFHQKTPPTKPTTKPTEAPESEQHLQRDDYDDRVEETSGKQIVERIRRETDGLLASNRRVMDSSFLARAAETRAAAANGVAIAEECVCPVCQELVVEPRIAAACGHAFCECCIASWVATGDGVAAACCPVCRVPMLATPVPCIALLNVVRRVIALLPAEERETYWGRVDAARMRVEDDTATRKLRSSIAAAKLHGTRFLNIVEEWTSEERDIFARGVSRYTGPARTLYCESVGLSAAWLRNAATADWLLIAAVNVGIPSAQSRPPRELRELLGTFIVGQ